MAIPASAEEYQPSTVAELRNRVLEDMRLQYERLGITDPDLGEGSDAYIRAEANARAEFALYSNNSLARRDSSESTAQGQALDDMRAALGLPEIPPSGAAGTVVPVVQDAATVTFFDGTEFRLDNGKAGKVNGTQSGIQNGDQVVVIMTDTGADTNAESGDRIRWVSPPLFVETEGVVGPDGLTDGTGEETDDDKRNRILTRRQSIPGSANNAHLIEVVEASSSGIQKAFVYPALGGPASAKVALISRISIDTPKDFSRQVAASTVSLAAAAIAAEFSSADRYLTQSAVDELVDIALQLDLQGQDLGWKNATPWPNLETADAGRVTVSTATSSVDITVSANTTAEPEDNISYVSWWDATEQEFVQSLVIGHSGTAGAWQLDLATPLTGVAVSDFISPAAINGDEYRRTWLGEMGTMGPGENTAVAARLASDRGYRFPRTVQSKRGRWPSDLTTVQLSGLITGHDEISDAIYSYQSKTSPTVPGAVGTAPNILRMRRFAIYQKI